MPPVVWHILVTLAFAGGLRIQKRVFLGQPVSMGEAPWAVKIYKTTKNGVSGCSGTIIKENWILTAAHCCQNPGEMDYTLKLQVGWSPSKPPLTTTSKLCITHPNYNKLEMETWGYDIGLIHLNEPLDISGTDVRAVDIPNTANVPAESSNLTFVGFGQTCDKTNFCERKPKLVHLTVERKQRWQRRYGHFGRKFLDQTFGALNEKRQRTYRGDSGGGLIMFTNNQKTVVGIASGSPKVENIQAPSIVVRVAAHLQWIHEVILKVFPGEQVPKAGGLATESAQ
ncbi:hypothetical protein CRM22_004882 [Opisthorchis felineus]|uniref:Peptidase S1 domain-containing protein n=1 Tax=Opisthorchis felineus TaxID=147828 RepID=A0A4S2LU01_OPIFE|nr:hypothetical protein CRM22_004882 [Opisthorchis felineus]TGZ67283.1 hypothetical protein CRM22_004882 [Opisthorchis felineus]